MAGRPSNTALPIRITTLASSKNSQGSPMASIKRVMAWGTCWLAMIQEKIEAVPIKIRMTPVTTPVLTSISPTWA